MPKVRKFLYFIAILFYLCFAKYTLAEEIESTNFIIRGDNLSAGAGNGSSTNFDLTADINPFSDLSNSTSFRQEVGYNPRIQAFTTNPATLENSENYYDRLLIIIDPSNNPTDTLFAVAISDNDFSTYQYVQNDGTIGDTLGIEDYLTYAPWGEASGSYILGLNQNTAYKVRVKALNGDFTETGYSSDSNEATTTVPYINMTVSATQLPFGVLNVNSVSSTNSLTVRVNTNAYSGYQLYVNDTGNGASPGLFDGSNNLIESADMVLSAGVPGYGAQATSFTASIDPKYNVSGNQVGGLDLSSNEIAANTGAVSDENTNVVFKATMAATTKAGNYNDVVYFTVSPNL